MANDGDAGGSGRRLWVPAFFTVLGVAFLLYGAFFKWPLALIGLALVYVFGTRLAGARRQRTGLV